MLARALALVILLPAAAHAEVTSLERWLLPADLADRVEGSGIKGRTLAREGARHDFDVASLQLRVTPALTVRGGLGVASYASALDDNRSGLAFAAGAAFASAEVHGFCLVVDVEATRATYGDGVLTDATVILAVSQHGGR